MSVVTPLSTESAHLPASTPASPFKVQLDDLLERATPEEREDEAFVLCCVGNIAASADPLPNTLMGHSCRVSRLARRIGEHMELRALMIERIAAAALFHDIGKTLIDGRIWTKPSMLDAEEFEVVKMHPILGADLIRPYRALEAIIPGIELHHEALDGSGYPYHLEAAQIPVVARVTTVADAFDAMTSMRTYQAAIGTEPALTTMRALAGVKFDRSAVDALCGLLAAPARSTNTGSAYQDLVEGTF